jgi:uncharacterized repeat protein (TIGR02543 family)
MKLLLKIQTSLFAAMVGLLVLAGCSEPFSSVPEKGKGTVTINIGGGDNSRTIFPQTPVFSRYELQFTPNDGQAAKNPESVTNGSTTITLATGSWTITAIAYINVSGIDEIPDGEYEAARGSNDLTVNTGTNSVSIDIQCDVEDGTGVFSYELSYPDDVSAALLKVLSLEGDLIEEADLTAEGSAGLFTLDSGYYLLRVELERGEGKIVKVEVIHIYKNLITIAQGGDFSFDGNDFLVAIDTDMTFTAGTMSGYSADGISFNMAAVPGRIPFPIGEYNDGRAVVSYPYQMSETEVTWELWNTVRTWAVENGYSMNEGKKGSGGSGSDQQPVGSVNWYDCVVWCNALTEYWNEKTGANLATVYNSEGSPIRDTGNTSALNGVTPSVTARGFRLPTNNEWELAARWRNDDTNTVDGYSNPWFTKGNSASGATANTNDNTATGNVAVYYSNSGNSTDKVKSKNPNALGLYDISGNVWEWCFEVYTIRGGPYNGGNNYQKIGVVYGQTDNPPYLIDQNHGFRIARTGYKAGEVGEYIPPPITGFIVDDFTDTNNSANRPGTLRHAINNANDEEIIRLSGVTPGVTTIALTDRLVVNKSITIEGNGVTLTRDASWTATSKQSQLLFIGNSATVTISRIHFKNGRSTDWGGAIHNAGTATLESCIFSGNQMGPGDGHGGAVINYVGNDYSQGGNLFIKGCTFYVNSSSWNGGAVCNASGTLYLTGNLFYGNTASNAGPAVHKFAGNITSNGYNVVDVPLGTGNTQSGWSPTETDKTINSLPISLVNFEPIPGAGAYNVITTLPAGYPTKDFYGNLITNGAAAGAVQSMSGANWHAVTFNTDGGTPAPAQQFIEDGGKVTRPETNPAKSGNNFEGWYKAGLTTLWDFANDTVTGDVTIYAKWTARHTVTFDTDSGAPVPAQQFIEDGGKVTRPETDPAKSGYTFDNWYKDSGFTTLWNFNTDTVTANTTIYAKLDINKYTVTFDSNGGTTVSPITQVNHGSTIIKPADPTKTGGANVLYEFNDWYYLNQSSQQVTFNFSTPITDNITLYARWNSFLTVTDFTDGDANTPGTIRYALANVDSGGVIRFTGATGQTITLTSELSINKSVAIEGNSVILNGNGSTRILNVSSGTVTISRVHFKNGRTTAPAGGAAIWNNGSLTLESCIFSGNQSTYAGGAIANNNSNLNIKGCTFYQNNTINGSAGAIRSSTSLTLSGSLFYGNTGSSATGKVIDADFYITVNATNGFDISSMEGYNSNYFLFSDLSISGAPFDTATFEPTGANLRYQLMNRPSGNFPTTDFNGDTRTFPGAPGAVK